MNWRLPNQLTVGRLVLAGVFFALLAMYELPGGQGGLLNLCFGLYIVAGITDMLDGYIARKWGLTTAFGRITDPFVDKVLVCGAFTLLTGSNFSFAHDPHLVGTFEASLPPWVTGNMASGVQAWMVVVVVAREFIVSGIRGYSESCGEEFHPTVWGKLKMLTQSVAICTVLFQLANLGAARWAIVMKLVLIWLTVVVTILSGLAYVNRVRHLLVSDTASPARRERED